MAKITRKNKTIEVEDGDKIKEACKKMGISFGCENGMCGTCMINILEGEENLSELTEEEDILERDRFHRLACQCRIKKGEVKIEGN